MSEQYIIDGIVHEVPESEGSEPIPVAGFAIDDGYERLMENFSKRYSDPDNESLRKSFSERYPDLDIAEYATNLTYVAGNKVEENYYDSPSGYPGSDENPSRVGWQPRSACAEYDLASQLYEEGVTPEYSSVTAFSPEEGRHTKLRCNNCKEIPTIGDTVTEVLKNKTEIPSNDFFIVPLKNESDVE